MFACDKSARHCARYISDARAVTKAKRDARKRIRCAERLLVSALVADSDTAERKALRRCRSATGRDIV